MEHQIASFLTVVLAVVAIVSGETSIKEDGSLDVPGLLTKYGYPHEVHEVQTEDGYLLTMHRITGAKGQSQQADKPVVFLMHGILCSSAIWIVMGPENGFGYLLADKGYDVWMGNARGNTYSRKHVSLNPDEDSDFWKFSWNEIGYYDLPAMIDYVLAETGNTQLHYAGHSQGSTSFFVMCAMKKEYNKKIKLMHALAPIAYTAHLKSPVLRFLAPFANNIQRLAPFIGADEQLPTNAMMIIATDLMCNDHSVMQPVCSNFLFLLVGNSPELLNKTMLPIILSHTPAGGSSRQSAHYSQGYTSGKFQKFDFGINNLIKYRMMSPPSYPLKEVTAPVALYYSDNDFLASTEDVEQLAGELGNLVGKFKVPNPKFNHLDFLWAIGVRSLVYDGIVELMKENQ